MSPAIVKLPWWVHVSPDQENQNSRPEGRGRRRGSSGPADLARITAIGSVSLRLEAFHFQWKCSASFSGQANRRTFLARESGQVALYSHAPHLAGEL